MRLPLASTVREWKELSRFRSLDRSLRSIVFYAEDSGSWVHFEAIIGELIGRLGQPVCYVTSDRNDPVLTRRDQLILPFYVGSGSARTVFFRTLNADVMVMTMPDLGTFHIKRSRYPVHYVYVHHSMVSTHMVYRPAAFDNFDSILCVGPHHKEEIRAREELYGLRRKILVEHGYGRLDAVIALASAHGEDSPGDGAPGNRVLVAPSWGDDALVESWGLPLVQMLVASGHRVTLRPHPMTIRRSPKVIAQLRRSFGSHPGFQFDTNMAAVESLRSADVMVSDWSGVAFEYAFGFERPVLYVDVPRKVNNPEYQKLPELPIEVSLRSEIGAVVSPRELSVVPARIQELLGDRRQLRQRVRQLRSRWIYNVGSSGAVGAAYVAEVARRARGAVPAGG